MLVVQYGHPIHQIAWLCLQACGREITDITIDPSKFQLIQKVFLLDWNQRNECWISWGFSVSTQFLRCVLQPDPIWICMLGAICVCDGTVPLWMLEHWGPKLQFIQLPTVLGEKEYFCSRHLVIGHLSPVVTMPVLVSAWLNELNCYLIFIFFKMWSSLFCRNFVKKILMRCLTGYSIWWKHVNMGVRHYNNAAASKTKEYVIRYQ